MIKGHIGWPELYLSAIMHYLKENLKEIDQLYIDQVARKQELNAEQTEALELFYNAMRGANQGSELYATCLDWGAYDIPGLPKEIQAQIALEVQSIIDGGTKRGEIQTAEPLHRVVYKHTQASRGPKEVGALYFPSEEQSGENEIFPAKIPAHLVNLELWASQIIIAP